MTKPKKPKLPTSGGSYVVQSNGALKKTASTKTTVPTAPATAKKEEEA